MQHIIFDGELTLNFTPLTLTRPTFDLTLGAKTLLQNLTEELNLKEYALQVQPHLTETSRQRHGRKVNLNHLKDEAVLINGLVKADSQVKKLLRRKERFAAFSGGQLALARLSGRDAEAFLTSGSHALKVLKSSERLELPESVLTRYPWQFIERNPEAIEDQVKSLPRGEAPDLRRCSVLGRRSNLLFEGGVEVEPYVTFDVRRGSIYIGADAEIQSFTRIEGPAYIGRRVQIRSALVRGGTTVDDYCKVGGEVDCSILSRYSNKAHDGFLGHSYVGEWVNIGAGTFTSDLKNTYGVVRMDIRGVKTDTEGSKVGCFIADYAKTSIGCLIYTGKTVGVSSHIHGYVSEDVPSFTLHAKSLTGRSFELQLDSALETQKRMMARRGVKQTAQNKALLTKVFEITQEDRYRSGVLKTRFTI